MPYAEPSTLTRSDVGHPFARNQGLTLFLALFQIPIVKGKPLLKIYTNLHIMPSGYNLNLVYNVSQAVLLTIRVQEFRLQNPRSYYHNKRAVTGLRIDVLSPENAL